MGQRGKLPSPPVEDAPTLGALSPDRDGKWDRGASAEQVINVAAWGTKAPARFVLPVLLLASGLLARPLARLAGRLRRG